MNLKELSLIQILINYLLVKLLLLFKDYFIYLEHLF